MVQTYRLRPSPVHALARWIVSLANEGLYPRFAQGQTTSKLLLHEFLDFSLRVDILSSRRDMWSPLVRPLRM
jgi:hypothetical protein